MVCVTRVVPLRQVRIQMFCGRRALIMPHCTAVSVSDRASTVDMVRQTLTDRFHKQQLKHQDVAWRNLGLHRMKNGEVIAVVFDLSSVIPDHSEDWVDAAMNSLLDRI
jgi:hypothetical protein